MKTLSDLNYYRRIGKKSHNVGDWEIGWSFDDMVGEILDNVKTTIVRNDVKKTESVTKKIRRNHTLDQSNAKFLVGYNRRQSQCN